MLVDIVELLDECEAAKDAKVADHQLAPMPSLICILLSSAFVAEQ